MSYLDRRVRTMAELRRAYLARIAVLGEQIAEFARHTNEFGDRDGTFARARREAEAEIARLAARIATLDGELTHRASSERVA